MSDVQRLASSSIRWWQTSDCVADTVAKTISVAFPDTFAVLKHDGYYLTGWTLIPPNMMPHHGEGGRGIFHPVDALDCAGFRGAGQGVLVARATYDANHCVHPVSVSHHLAAEGDLTVGAHIFAERLLLGE